MTDDWLMFIGCLPYAPAAGGGVLLHLEAVQGEAEVAQQRVAQALQLIYKYRVEYVQLHVTRDDMSC